MRTVTTEEVLQKQQSGSDFLLVNTLDPEHYPKTKIPGSINIPQEDDDFAAQVEKQAGSKDKEIVVYCASESCNSSPKGAEKLEKAGFTNVSDYEGGAEAWQKAGQELAAV